MSRPTTRSTFLRSAVAVLAFAATLLACAPVARPAAGPLADQVVAAMESGSASFDHSDFSGLLEQGVRDGLVDYRFFQENRAKLDAYLSRVGQANLQALERGHLMALLINAYNAYTIESILDHPGVTSIKEIDGVWKERTHRVGGFDLTLDNLEHNLLRPYYKDPRVHFAVNCASQSCAPLPTWAFDGSRVDQQLEEWTQRFFRNMKYLRVEDETLLVSRLLDWYGSDFIDPESSPRADTLVGFIRTYSSPDVVQFIDAEEGDPDLEFLPYDWSLNQAPDE